MLISQIPYVSPTQPGGGGGRGVGGVIDRCIMNKSQELKVFHGRQKLTSAKK